MAEGKYKNFHGKKGRSGRKTMREEALRQEVILKAWLKKHEKMSDQDATQIVLKDMGEKIKGDKENPLSVAITEIKYITPNVLNNSSTNPKTA